MPAFADCMPSSQGPYLLVEESSPVVEEGLHQEVRLRHWDPGPLAHTSEITPHTNHAMSPHLKVTKWTSSSSHKDFDFAIDCLNLFYGDVDQLKRTNADRYK